MRLVNIQEMTDSWHRASQKISDKDADRIVEGAQLLGRYWQRDE
jgi:hypothetical protein